VQKEFCVTSYRAKARVSAKLVIGSDIKKQRKFAQACWFQSIRIESTLAEQQMNYYLLARTRWLRFAPLHNVCALPLLLTDRSARRQSPKIYVTIFREFKRRRYKLNSKLHFLLWWHLILLIYGKKIFDACFQVFKSLFLFWLNLSWGCQVQQVAALIAFKQAAIQAVFRDYLLRGAFGANLVYHNCVLNFMPN
jgi:hypothetical protein